MYSFKDDYAELGHEKVLTDLIKISREQMLGYGKDCVSIQAKELISNRFGLGNADIHFLAGGTQTNLVFIDATLRKFEAVIAPDSGHICVMEAGAIERNGNKIITAPNCDGKLRVQVIERICKPSPLHEHMVSPKLVYISQPTEKGTLYSKQELVELYETCKKFDLYLYVDGARLGAALASHNTDIAPEDMAILCDAFYIGGTKNGSPLGEALCIINDDLKPHFRKYMKQHGALLAKGALIASCFKSLFENDLFFELATHANKTARKLCDALIAHGFSMRVDSPTNQLFPILPNDKIAELQKHFEFYPWETLDNNTSVVRLICSWATDEAQVDKFIKMLITTQQEELTLKPSDLYSAYIK